MENTRETIISSAFSFYKKPVFKNISLSMIADRVGISKTAIYRHFKNKEDLEKAMTDRVYSDLYGILKKICPESERNTFSIVEDVIVLLMTHSEYLYYLISTRTKLIVDEFFLKIKSMGLSLFDGIFDNDGSVIDMDTYKKAVYLSGNILYFQIVRNKIYAENNIADSYNQICDYAKSMSGFITRGLGEDTSGISVFRLATLDDVCRRNMENLSTVNRIFTSVASIVKEKGFQGVTVESVARRIGLAKSSIYSKFENKAQMISSLIHQEFEEMFGILKKNLLECRNNAERAYTIMETELLYFMKKTELFTVCRWLQFQTTDEIMQDEENHERIFHEFIDGITLYENYPDLGLPVQDERIISSWFFMIPVFLYMHTLHQKIAPEIAQAALKDIFYMMENGVK